MKRTYNLIKSDDPPLRLEVTAMLDGSWFFICNADEIIYGVANKMAQAIKVFEHAQAGNPVFVCASCGDWIPAQENVAQCLACLELICIECGDEMWAEADAEPPVCPVCEYRFDEEPNKA